MAETIPTYLVAGWEIEALPEGMVHARLRFARTPEELLREEWRYVPLGMSAAMCLELADALRAKAEQSLTRKKPVTQ